MKVFSKDAAQQAVVDFLRKKRNIEEIAVASVEQKDGVWIVDGTCPINLQGHPWTERFEVIIDRKGKIKSMDFSLL